MQTAKSKDQKFLLELGKRIRNEGGATENQVVCDVAAMDQRNGKLPSQLLASNGINLANQSCRVKDKREDHRIPDGQNHKADSMPLSDVSVSSFAGEDQKEIGGDLCPFHKFVEKRKEQKEKNKHKSNANQGKECTERDKEKKNKSKDKRGEKNKEKEKEVKESRNLEQTESRGKRGTSIDIHSNEHSQLLNELNGSKKNLGKRKDNETNGVLHEDEIRSNKLSRSLLSCHQVMRNGHKHHSSQTAVQSSLEKETKVPKTTEIIKSPPSQSVVGNARRLELSQTVSSFQSGQGAAFSNCEANDHLLSTTDAEIRRKLDSSQPALEYANIQAEINKRVNGMLPSFQPVLENGWKLYPEKPKMLMTIGRKDSVHEDNVDDKDSEVSAIRRGQPSKTSLKLLSTPVQVKENSERGRKPPHPDLKYLSQILAVPKLEWSELDNQEWLFGNQDLQVKKPAIESSQIEGTRQVLSEALVLESANVTALPYVIPY